MVNAGPTPKQHYADSAELERHWAAWLAAKAKGETAPENWRQLQEGIYKICQGVATQFNPRDDDEHEELSHETFVLTIDKIESGKLIFKPGKAPVFNLLTTTIFRHLYSFKNKQNRRHKLLLTKYLQQPGVINRITDDRPDLARALLTNRHDQPREVQHDPKATRDIPRYVLDPIDTLNDADPEYRLFALMSKGRDAERTVAMQFTRSKARIKRNVEVAGDTHNFLCELIEVLDRAPERYAFNKCTSTRGAKIHAQCRWIDREIGGNNHRYLYVVFVEAKVTLMVERSRIDGLIMYISDFIDKLSK
jgi:hypothetical protein